MIDRATINRLLFTVPRTVERLRARTLGERFKPRPEVLSFSVDEIEAITTDLELLARALGEARQQLRALRTQERTA